MNFTSTATTTRRSSPSRPLFRRPASRLRPCRAWERRYGVLSPGRSEGGYRLYSERDIAILRWLKRQVDAGVSISRAVALLEIRHPGGEDDMAPASPRAGLPAGARSPAAISDDLLDALMAFDEARADALLSEAFAIYPVEQVAEEILVPTLVEVGERWHRGEATVVQEHFATAILRRRLSVMFHAYDQPAAGPLAITGSAPTEWHDVGILLVSLALRRNGWRVIYLGQNVPADQLLQEIRRLHPDLVCLSATTREGAAELAHIYEGVAALPRAAAATGFRRPRVQSHPGSARPVYRRVRQRQRARPHRSAQIIWVCSNVVGA